MSTTWQSVIAVRSERFSHLHSSGGNVGGPSAVTPGQWSSTRGHPVPQETVTVSGDILGCHRVGALLAAGGRQAGLSRRTERRQPPPRVARSRGGPSGELSSERAQEIPDESFLPTTVKLIVCPLRCGGRGYSHFILPFDFLNRKGKLLPWKTVVSDAETSQYRALPSRGGRTPRPLRNVLSARTSHLPEWGGGGRGTLPRSCCRQPGSLREAENHRRPGRAP